MAVVPLAYLALGVSLFWFLLNFSRICCFFGDKGVELIFGSPGVSVFAKLTHRKRNSVESAENSLNALKFLGFLSS